MAKLQAHCQNCTFCINFLWWKFSTGSPLLYRVIYVGTTRSGYAFFPTALVFCLLASFDTVTRGFFFAFASISCYITQKMQLNFSYFLVLTTTSFEWGGGGLGKGGIFTRTISDRFDGYVIINRQDAPLSKSRFGMKYS